MKFINSFDILKSDLQKSTTTRPFTIQGDANAIFDLKITNSAGKFYNFITGVFATNEITSTTSATSSDATTNQVYITAANANIKIGMTVTGNGMSETVLVTNVNSQIITLNKNVEIDVGTTLKFSATAGLNAQALSNSGFYKNSIIFPTISSNDVAIFRMPDQRQIVASVGQIIGKEKAMIQAINDNNILLRVNNENILMVLSQ